MLEPPSDKETWQGVSRRDNLLNFDKNTTFTVNDIMKMLDTKIPDGGATWDLTIYQMVYDSTTNDLYLKRTLEDNEWQHVELNDLFNKNLEVQGNYIDL